jgi:predicted TIM-barrel fold metal-dependent hydrolase
MAGDSLPTQTAAYLAPNEEDTMAERIISADSHMLVLDERVLAHLDERYHEAYRGHMAPPLRPAPMGPEADAETHRGSAGPSLPAEGRPGEWDPHERLKDMDIDGVDAEVLYTDTAAGARFYKITGDACLAVFQAYNSAAIEFASIDPSRLVPVYLLPLHDIEAAIKEVQRIAGEGGRAVQVPLYPTDAGLPAYYDDRYEALWSAIEDIEMPVSLHVVPPSGRGLGRDPTPARGIFQAMPTIFMSQALTELIVTGTFVRHPKLRVVLVEAGLGWIPYMIDRLDRVCRKSMWKERGMTLKEMPSYYWHHNMAATFEEDELGLELRERIGVENLFWATDYPHADSTWPESQKVIHEQFRGCTKEEMRKMICENAARLYHL